ncbi:hypothetical protein ABT218_26200, partial [Streptomyces sp. NPDC001455]
VVIPLGPGGPVDLLPGGAGSRQGFQAWGEGGDWHAQAQRHLLNRMIGQLYHCLQTRQLFDEDHAFTSSSADLAVAADLLGT